MIPRRDADGWRDLGPFTWKVECEDNHGDQSTTTMLTLTMVTRWTLNVNLTRSWKPEPDPAEDMD